jgi:hypothetical protein
MRLIMITREEKLFVEGLISALKCLEVENIPFANLRFRDGVARLKDFIVGHKAEYAAIDDIEIIFVKRPPSGDYDRLKRAMEALNGTRLGFALENPKWESALIRTERKLAEEILEHPKYDLPKEFMLKAAKEFCSGVGIAC